MAGFSELIKNINRIREYIREFFVFGWRSRSEYDINSLRSYDDEKRRAESWFGDYVKKYVAPDGRKVFSISLSGADHFDRNPLYEVWRTKTFTENDMFLHFAILDLLSRDVSTWACGEKDPDAAATAEFIAREISMADGYGEDINSATVKIKLDEYCENGILVKRCEGERVLYSLHPASWRDLSGISENAMTALDFFTEAAPLGVIGSYIQDEAEQKNEFFRFANDFMAPTLDDEVLLDLFAAIGERRAATIYFNNDKDGALNSQLSAVPLRIMASVENGRRCVAMMEGGILMFRELETIHRVERHGVSPEFFKYREKLDNYLRKCWSSDYERDIDTGKLKKAERVQMRLAIDSGDDMRILRRLLSEGRNGTVSVEIPGVYVYRNELWDAREILAFVFSFIGHILSFKSDNEEAAQIFRENIEKMSAMYCVSLDVETEGSDD